MTVTVFRWRGGRYFKAGPTIGTEIPDELWAQYEKARDHLYTLEDGIDRIAERQRAAEAR